MLVQGTSEDSITEQVLRDLLNQKISDDLNFVEENKNIGFYSTNEAIDIVLKYDETISEVNSQLRAPKAMIQAVLFKEIRMQDARDVVADAFVAEYYRYNNTVDSFVEAPLWRQLLIGAPQPNLPMREDSSTGLGQIFAGTAINAYNSAIERGDINGEYIDYDNRREREEVWHSLQDNKTNIFYVGLVLKDKAGQLGVNLGSASDDDIKMTLSRYNGTNAAAQEYGKETLQYYYLFDRYNK